MQRDRHRGGGIRYRGKADLALFQIEEHIVGEKQVQSGVHVALGGPERILIGTGPYHVETGQIARGVLHENFRAIGGIGHRHVIDRLIHRDGAVVVDDGGGSAGIHDQTDNLVGLRRFAHVQAHDALEQLLAIDRAATGGEGARGLGCAVGRIHRGSASKVLAIIIGKADLDAGRRVGVTTHTQDEALTQTGARAQLGENRVEAGIRIGRRDGRDRRIAFVAVKRHAEIAIEMTVQGRLAILQVLIPLAHVAPRGGLDLPHLRAKGGERVSRFRTIDLHRGIDDGGVVLNATGIGHCDRFTRGAEFLPPRGVISCCRRAVGGKKSRRARVEFIQLRCPPAEPHVDAKLVLGIGGRTDVHELKRDGYRTIPGA